jgi:uncharacterized membrane protein
MPESKGVKQKPSADSHPCLQIVESGFVSAGLPCWWIDVEIRCRLTRQLVVMASIVINRRILLYSIILKVEMTTKLSPINSSSISPEDSRQLELLREHRRRHRQMEKDKSRKLATLENIEVPTLTSGQRIADRVASTIGSWRFIIFQSTGIFLWIIGNVLSGANAWDPYPFILLNLLLSFQAAYTAPAIMMSQNRQSELDRRHAQNDYEINVKAELEIELLHEKIDILKEQELLRLTDSVRDLSAQLEKISIQLVNKKGLAQKRNATQRLHQRKSTKPSVSNCK